MLGALGALTDASRSDSPGAAGAAPAGGASQNALNPDAKLAANWVLGEVSAALNQDALAFDAARVSAPALAQLLARLRAGMISGKIAKDVFAAMWAGEGDADAIIEKRGLRADLRLRRARGGRSTRSLAEYPTQLADYRGGNDKLLQFFVGQVMKRTRGQANPQQLNALMREKLVAMKPETVGVERVGVSVNLRR